MLMSTHEVMKYPYTFVVSSKTTIESKVDEHFVEISRTLRLFILCFSNTHFLLDQIIDTNQLNIEAVSENENKLLGFPVLMVLQLVIVGPFIACSV